MILAQVVLQIKGHNSAMTSPTEKKKIGVRLCELDRLNKLSFPHPMEAPYEIVTMKFAWIIVKCGLLLM